MAAVNRHTEKGIKRYETMLAVAKMYYYEDMSQNEIAFKFGMSRSNISRILNICKQEGIVDIRIDDSTLKGAQLGAKIKETFGLKEAVVVPSSDDLAVSKMNIGKFAARYFEKVLKDGMIVDITWGSMVYYTVQYLRSHLALNLDVVQIVGSLSGMDAAYDGNNIVKDLAAKMNGKAHVINAPLILKNSDIRDELMKEPAIHETLELAKNAGIVLTGLGSNKGEDSFLLKTNYLTREYAEELYSRGYYGGVCGWMLDKDGKFADIEYNKRVVALDLESIRKIPLVIAVVGGENKSNITLSALKSGCIDVLITDEKIAGSVVETYAKQQ